MFLFLSFHQVIVYLRVSKALGSEESEGSRNRLSYDEKKYVERAFYCA
jgi:hypothetical protein